MPVAVLGPALARRLESGSRLDCLASSEPAVYDLVILDARKRSEEGALECATNTEPQALGTLLLVDDQPELRRLLRRCLARVGHQIAEASNARTALELARCTRFDLVISDVRMPDMTGIELLQALSELDPDLPVVLVSGSFDGEAARAVHEYAAFGYLMKPVPFETLQRVAVEAIGLRRARAARHASNAARASFTRLRVPGRGER